MNNLASMLGTGLLRKEQKIKSMVKNSKNRKRPRRSKRDESVEIFLREILGTGLVQLEKNFNSYPGK